MRQTITIFLLIIGIGIFTNLGSSLAAASSPSPSPISDEIVTENLKKRLQESLEDADTGAKDSLTYRSLVGIIKDVIKTTLVIEDKEGKKNIIFDDQTKIIRSPGNTSIKADSIRIEDYIIGIGTFKESDELVAVRIIVSTNPLSTNTKKAESGRLVKTTKNTLTLASLTDPSQETVLTITSKTKLKSSLGETLDTADLNVGDSLIYTATQSAKETTATSIMRIGFADPEASPSPSPDSN